MYPDQLKDKSFHTVFIDAPCSGSGVLRRNPEDRWRLDEKMLKKLLKAQREVLSSYSPLVEKGGELIYVTCSFFIEEDELMVEHFLKDNSSFELVDASKRLKENLQLSDVDQLVDGKYLRISPDSGGDLFFGAVMRKK